MYVVRTARPTLVLGSTQSLDMLDGEQRRRRTRCDAAAVVAGSFSLQPDDLWIDWWIPADDPRWRSDVHASSRMAGRVVGRRVARRRARCDHGSRRAARR